MLRRAKKILLSGSVMVLFALYVLQERTHSSVDPSITAGYVATVTAVPSTSRPSDVPSRSPGGKTSDLAGRTPTVTAARASTEPTASATSTDGTYQDGTYTGAAEDAYWGTVQVRAVVVDGQISTVQFLQHPDHRSQSQSINQQADPVLIQEAIRSQRADVDIVTGATYTSEAFIQSLSSALAQAAP